jgi:membrane-bound metal-dependent hydrolase YbcI (DUF457 family)
MPSPIGHLLAGAAIAVGGRAPEPSGRRTSPDAAPWLLPLGAMLAALPDADLLFPVAHRGATHSVTAAALVFIIAAAVTGWVTGRVSWRIAALCGLAYASHLPLDWLSADTYPPRGIQMLWPFSDTWFISELDLFPRIERRQPFSIPTMTANAWAAVVEIVVMAPVLAAIAYVRGRRQKTRGYP